MGLSFFLYCSILALLSHFLFVSTTTTTTNNARNFESITRGLNLFLVNDANIVEKDPLSGKALIVEKPFRFPFLYNEYETADSDGASVKDLGHYAGYYRLDQTKGATMFYYFFESRHIKTKDPVVVWLSGGPGCSSSLALFNENGPFYLSKNLSLVWNDYGWDKGFSYSSNWDDIRIGSDEAAVDFYNFIQAFFKEHPKYASHDFYITGESYAGHYIPAFAAKGMAIGNGLTNPGIQYKAYPDYALDMKLINRTQYNELRQPVSTCQHLVNKNCLGTKSSSACAQAFIYCEGIFGYMVNSVGGINYDIRKQCKGDICYDFSYMERFLANSSVKEALGVGENMEFVSCSDAVYDAMMGDCMLNFAVDIPELLEDGIKLLVYAGEYDLICNWLGNSRWVHDMNWSGQQDFLSSRDVTFKVDHMNAGLVKSHGPLTFLKMYNAGHMVPMDQPKPALEMLRKWTQGIPL
ncbi:hypothetical protein OROGR_017887 [Orobanche gracilis]